MTQRSGFEKFTQIVSKNPIIMIVVILIISPFVAPYKALSTQIIIFGLLALGYNILPQATTLDPLKRGPAANPLAAGQAPPNH